MSDQQVGLSASPWPRWSIAIACTVSGSSRSSRSKERRDSAHACRSRTVVAERCPVDVYVRFTPVVEANVADTRDLVHLPTLARGDSVGHTGIDQRHDRTSHDRTFGEGMKTPRRAV